MATHCKFCREPLPRPHRSTRQYCNDNCKQLAFYARQGKKWGMKHASEESLLKKKLPFNVKPDFTLNGNGQQEKIEVPEVLPEPEKQQFDGAEENAVTEQTNFTVNDKLQDHPQVLPAENGLAQEKNEGIKAITVKPDFTLNGNGQHKKELEPEIMQQRGDHQPDNEKTEVIVKSEAEKPDSIKQPPKPNYFYVGSPLLDALDRLREQAVMEIPYSAEEMFISPNAYWVGDKLVAVRWISLRLRCLLENILRISNYASINRETLVEISNALEQLTDSIYFRMVLETHYPFTDLITDLRNRFRLLLKHARDKEIILRLTFEDKTQLIYARFCIGDFVPRENFSELNFSDGIRQQVERDSYKEKEKESEEDDRN